MKLTMDIFLLYRGELWHRLREEDFTGVEGFEEECSAELVQLIKSMMRKDASRRPSAGVVYGHRSVARARAKMEEGIRRVLRMGGERRTEMLFKYSPLGGVEEGFLEDVLGRVPGAMGGGCRW